jgi:hypothetical protein
LGLGIKSVFFQALMVKVPAFLGGLRTPPQMQVELLQML